MSTSDSQPAAPKNCDSPDSNTLDNLLDDALADFEKKPTKPVRKESSVPKPKAATATTAAAAATIPSEQDELRKLFGFASNPDEANALADELLKLSQIAGQPPVNSGPMAGISLQETLQQLSRDADCLKDDISEAEMNKMFEGLRLGSAGGGAGGDGGSGGAADGVNGLEMDGLIPMMEGMMQSLLSKDLLYPAIKEMNDKFPDWLADNRTQLAEREYERYNRQYEKTRQICHEFEREAEGEPETEKTARFHRVMALMQEMQELGQPPKELVGETPAGLEFDSEGRPVLPGVQEQCVIS